MAKREKKCECEQGAPLWVVTYGDLMSLLMTFFVLLLSFSVITEEEVFQEAIEAFRGSVGILPKELTMVQINPKPQQQTRPSRAVEELARRLQRRLQVLGQEERVRVEFTPTGELKITLPNQVLFDTAQAQLKPASYPVLNDLSELLQDFPEAFFEVRGHTDNRPLTSASVYRDNYDLSFARADSVARYLQNVGRIPLEQFEIIACGAGQPVAPNTTPDGRSANRRVELEVRGLVTDEDIEEIQSRMEEAVAPN